MKIKLVSTALLAAVMATPAVAAPPYDDCPEGKYLATSGHCVQSPNHDPKGTAALCNDGTLSHSEHPNAGGTCSHHGGKRN